jgi:hypothetical protein
MACGLLVMSISDVSGGVMTNLRTRVMELVDQALTHQRVAISLAALCADWHVLDDEAIARRAKVEAVRQEIDELLGPQLVNGFSFFEMDGRFYLRLYNEHGCAMHTTVFDNSEDALALADMIRSIAAEEAEGEQ